MEPSQFILCLVICLPVAIWLIRLQEKQINSDACKFNSIAEFTGEVLSQQLKISSISGRYPGVIIDGTRYFVGTPSKMYKSSEKSWKFLGHKDLVYFAPLNKKITFRAREDNAYIATKGYEWEGERLVSRHYYDATNGSVEHFA